MPGRADAHVVPDQYGFKVVPPVVALSAGGTFTLANLTRNTVHASFPDTLMTNPEGDIAPQDAAVFNIRGDARRGVYDYNVVVIIVQRTIGNEGFTLEASGNSGPRIIID